MVTVCIQYELDVRNTQTEGDRPRKSGGPYDLRKVRLMLVLNDPVAFPVVFSYSHPV